MLSWTLHPNTRGIQLVQELMLFCSSEVFRHHVAACFLRLEFWPQRCCHPHFPLNPQVLHVHLLCTSHSSSTLHASTPILIAPVSAMSCSEDCIPMACDAAEHSE